MTAPVASGWSGCRVGLAPTGKRRLVTAHTRSGHSPRNKYLAFEDMGEHQTARPDFENNEPAFLRKTVQQCRS
jgi:hypothetical protein